MGIQVWGYEARFGYHCGLLYSSAQPVCETLLASLEELVERCADLIRTLDIREMPAVAQHDEAGSRNRLGDVGRTGDGDEIIVAMQDQGWDAQSSRARAADCIRSTRTSRARVDSPMAPALRIPSFVQPTRRCLDQPVEQLWRSQGRAEIDAIVRGSGLEVIALRKPWAGFQRRATSPHHREQRRRAPARTARSRREKQGRY